MMRFLASFAIACAPIQCIAADIAIALTEKMIDVDTSFSGARLTLFGAVTGAKDPATSVDIIAIVEGATTEFTVRQIEKRNIIWMPGDAHIVRGAPGLFVTSATRAITDIAPLPLQAEHHLQADFLPLETQAQSSEPDEAEHNRIIRAAFLNEVEDFGLYRDDVGAVQFEKGGLFRINIDLPANTPVGAYGVSVYLFQNGVILDTDQTTLQVDKVGIERRIYDLANERPYSYGIVCVALSLFAGWMASLAFRK